MQPNSAKVYLASPQKNLVLKVDTMWSQSWIGTDLRLRHEKFKQFKKNVETQFKKPVHGLNIDRRDEYEFKRIFVRIMV